MAVVQNSYQIFKLPLRTIIEAQCKIERYTINDGLSQGNVVSIGDNLVFQQLRYLHGDHRDHRETFNYITRLRNSMHAQSKLGNHKEASILSKCIVRALFVEDIINVVIDETSKKTDFNKIRTKGFYVNGKHYMYFCSGSGQIRRNTATFMDERYHAQITKILNCGLDEKTKTFVLAKYSAYFALGFSSVLWVRTPRVCVIKDFFNTLKNEPVDFITQGDEGKLSIEERHMDLELNCADGQGLIDPYFAQLWSQDMDLKYTPCSFVVRSCFIKGNLATFDYKEYARQHGISKIRDKWGIEYNIEDIDVILSESQFKTHKYYSSWQEYCKYAQSGNIHWGVARYNKREDDEYVLSNYQYIQALTLTNDDIKELIAPTVEWIKNICSGDLSYALLYLFGGKTPQIKYQSFLSQAETPATKAIVKNSEFLKDSYVRKKIYKNIAETINYAKIGKIWIRGNYQFMVSDPLAQCQAALGLPVTGGLKRDQVWSKFWIDRFAGASPDQNCIIDTCRSPMIDVHEHNPMNVVVDSDEANYWYRYMYSGVIYSIYDTSCFRHEDSDYDGDIVLSTDNPYFIKGSHKDHNIITYEKGIATPGEMTIDNITKTVMKGFGTGVGGFSNTATILYAMSAIFSRPGDEERQAEIFRRIKLLRQIVGQEIDRIKGADKPSLPKEWKTIEKILPSDTQDEINRKIRANAMVISKKPYFFRYLYPSLNEVYKCFEAQYNSQSLKMFGIKFKKLLKKEDQTDEERTLIKQYQKYSPLITAPCTMNRFCKEFEDIDFDIVYSRDSKTGSKTPQVSMLPTFADKFESSFTPQKLASVKKLYQQYSQQTKKAQTTKALDVIEFDSQFDDEVGKTVYDSIFDEINSNCRLQLDLLSMDYDEFLYYCYRLSSTYASFDWRFPWSVIGDEMINYIPDGQTFCPVHDDDAGDIQYLGRRYSLIELPHNDPSDYPPGSFPQAATEVDEQHFLSEAGLTVQYYTATLTTEPSPHTPPPQKLLPEDPEHNNPHFTDTYPLHPSSSSSVSRYIVTPRSASPDVRVSPNPYLLDDETLAQVIAAETAAQQLEAAQQQAARTALDTQASSHLTETRDNSSSSSSSSTDDNVDSNNNISNNNINNINNNNNN